MTNQQQLHTDNLKLATTHTRQFRILQHVQKVKKPSTQFVGIVFLTWNS